jgi:ribosomal protein S18 acetylase RimI-like enzyme
MRGMVLVPAVEADYAAVVELANVAYRGGGEAASWNSEAGILAGQRIDDSLLREELAANPGGYLLTLRESPDDEILGTVWLVPKEGGTWYLGLLTIRPELQTRKLGRWLLTAAERFGMTHGAQRMRMTVLQVRSGLIAWYERRGYELTGETVAFPYGDDRFGRPLRDDLKFAVLEKELTGDEVRG